MIFFEENLEWFSCLKTSNHKLEECYTFKELLGVSPAKVCRSCEFNQHCVPPIRVRSVKIIPGLLRKGDVHKQHIRGFAIKAEDHAFFADFIRGYFLSILAVTE